MAKPQQAPGSLASAVAVGEPVFKEALQTGAFSLLPRLDGARIPTSLSEAQAVAQAKDDAKLKQKDNKSKGHKPQIQDPSQTQSNQPGVSIGSIADAAPFWMFVVRTTKPMLTLLQQVMVATRLWCHVSISYCGNMPGTQEEYFRDVTYEDIVLVAPKWLSISQDDAFFVPFLGRQLPQATEDGVAGAGSSRPGSVWGAGSSAGVHGPGSGRKAAQAARNLILSEMDMDQPEVRPTSW
jgi:hypothetical protein